MFAWVARVESLLAVVCVVATAALWQYPMILTALLTGIAAMFIYRSHHPYAVYVFIGAALGGSISETIAIWAGAWEYALPTLFLIPLWLPILWGNAALFILASARAAEK